MEAGFLTDGLISPLPKALCPNCSKLVFRSQTPNVWVLGSVIYFKLHKILHQISSYFTILVHFWQSYECLFPENCKELFKNSLFCAISDMQVPSSLVQKNPFYGALKFKYLWNRLAKFKKWAHSEILSLLRAFKWCKNQIILIKFQFWPTSLPFVNILLFISQAWYKKKWKYHKMGWVGLLGWPGPNLKNYI